MKKRLQMAAFSLKNHRKTTSIFILHSIGKILIFAARWPCSSMDRTEVS